MKIKIIKIINLTVMGTFWKKKNERNATPIKNEIQHYFNLPELELPFEIIIFKYLFINQVKLDI